LDTDTDEDGIDDYYEVNHAYDIKRVTPSVEFVMIGGVKYFDRTDPLNPDTDGDGLLDGEEGEFGPFYGLGDLYNETVEAGLDTPPLIFNGGYTHPLDNDTDDDTWEQLLDGDIAPSKAHAWVKIKDGSWILTSDWWEVKGMPIVYMIEGEPVLNVTYTNPCNPDTDGDTGIMDYNRTGAPDLEHNLPPISEILNSDGYELSLDPPSDPCDGLEGTRGSQSNHTHYAVADTDGDGLGDLQEILLGSNPLHPDGDHDMVNDGDEYFKYGTHPANPDTDFDGLLDGEELYWYHTNPFSVDRYLTSLVEKFCTETLGLSLGEITEYVEKISLFLKGAMDFLARFDVKNLVNEYLPQLLELVIGAFDSSLAEEYSSKIGVIIKLIMSGIKFIDLPLADILNEVMSLFDLGITAAQVNALIQKINLLISEAKETAMSSVTDFKAGLLSGIDSLGLTIDSNIKTMIVTASTMVAGAINGDFTDKNNLPTLNETIDLVLGIVGGGSGAALSLPDSNTIKGIINTLVSLIAVITDKDEMKQYIASTVDNFKSIFSDPAKLIDGAIQLLFSGSSFDFNSSIMTKIRTFSEMGMALYRIIMAAKENSIQGILQALIQNVGLALVKEIGGVDIDFVKDILEFVFPKFFGTETSELPSAEELVNELKDTLENLLDDSMVASVGIPGITTVSDLKEGIGTVLKIVFNAKDIFNDGLRWLFGQLMDWVGGQIEILINMLMDAITSALDSSDLLPPEWSGSLPVALGGLSLFEIGIELGLYPHFGFDTDAFTDWMLDIVFGGLNPFAGDIAAFFGKIFSFFELIPTFKAGFELGGFGTEDNPLMAFLLESLGLELEFSGKGWFELELFTLKGGVFDTDNFFKVIEWGFSFTITVSRTFTLLDFLTGGTAGALNAVGGKNLLHT